MEEKARQLQHRLVYEACRKPVRAATSSRSQSRASTTTLKRTKSKLREQLAVNDRESA